MITIYKLEAEGMPDFHTQEKRTAQAMQLYLNDKDIKVSEIKVPDHNETMEMIAKSQQKE